MSAEEERYRAIFRRAHAHHRRCVQDEWLNEPCRMPDGSHADRPLVWSRRNGPWQRVPVLWVGAAPGNAGGRGSGTLGAHATRIPFGGDVAGANLGVLLASIGLDRNHTFIVAALNRLPDRGGGEPTGAELREPVGEYPSSLHLLRDTIVASGARLVVALGNVGLRALAAAAALETQGVRLPGLTKLSAAIVRGGVAPLEDIAAIDDPFRAAWQDAWGDDPLPMVLWLTHPSAQNMSPFAREETLFHTRMLDARDALRNAARDVLGVRLPRQRPREPEDGIYALPEWRALVGPHHARLDALWRGKGV